MAKIVYMGEYIPPTVRSNQTWSDEVVKSFSKHLQRDLLDILDDNIANKTDPISLRYFKQEANDPFLGATERRVADDQMESWRAEVLAAQSMLAKSNVDPKMIDICLSFSAIPEMLHINTSAVVLQHLGAVNAFGCGVENTCATVLSQL